MDFRLPNPSSMLTKANDALTNLLEVWEKDSLFFYSVPKTWPETKQTHGCQKVSRSICNIIPL
jgi:hypothetical protein